MKSTSRGFWFSVFILVLSFQNAYAQKLAVESTSGSSYAIDSNGILYAWGDNTFGQLGIGDTLEQNSPVEVPFPAGVTGWLKVAAGTYHCLAISDDSSLYAWGHNSFGQLGIGDTLEQKSPVKVPFPAGVTGWRALAAGLSQSFALGNDGNLYAWGANIYGELGIGNTSLQNSPVKVPFPSGVTGWATVATGESESYAISSDGNLYACGNNQSGQLGTGDMTNRLYFVKVSLPAGVTGWTAVTAGVFYCLALGNDGNLYAWGYNSDGQLGIGNTTNQSLPVQVPFPYQVTGWSLVTAGTNHSLAIGSDDNLYAWGSNYEGNNTSVQDTAVQVPFPSGITSWVAVTAGGHHSLAIGNNDDLYAWGDNSYGQLGIGNKLSQITPVPVSGVGGIGNLVLPIESSVKTVPGKITLGQNYPNPFNPTTNIRYSLPTNRHITLIVYNILGQLVTTLVDKYQIAGSYAISFNANALPSGMYIYQLKAGGYTETKTMLLIK